MRALIGAGSAGLLEGVSDDGAVTTYTVVDGGFAWTGDGSEGTWLAEGVDPEMAWSAMAWPDLDARLIVLDGAFSVEGGAIEMMVFEQALFINAGVGSTCPEEPSGAISALTGEGVWLDLIFDGASWEDVGQALEGCDGCGQIWHRGEMLGEVCPDFSPLLDWNERPNE